MSNLAVLVFVLALLLPSVSFFAYGVQQVQDTVLPPLMLAKEVKLQQLQGDVWVSEKLDGIRAYWNGRQFLTRSGNPIYAPSWFVQNLPATPLDGELWIGRGQFQKLASVVMDKIPKDQEWQEVGYYVFDLPKSELPFEARQTQLDNLVARSPVEHLHYVRQQLVRESGQLDAMLANVVDGGGEGLMLSKPDSNYEAGRTDTLIKLKPRYDAEAVVLAYEQGKGRFRGMMGSMLVKTEDGKEFKIGTGFTMDERENPPAIGSTITYQYRGYTDSGIPRFASFFREKIAE